MYEGIIQSLIDELGRLPGIGPKSAQRIAFHVIQSERSDIEQMRQDYAEKLKEYTNINYNINTWTEKRKQDLVLELV